MPVTYGTNGNDSEAYYAGSNNTYTKYIDMLAGNDKGYFYGGGSFNAMLGSGNDTAYIRSYGNTTIDGGSGRDLFYFERDGGHVNANGGSGSDYFYIKEHGSHDINGGTGNDYMSFYSSDKAVEVDFSGSARGTAYSLINGNVDNGSGLDFTSVETVFGSVYNDRAFGSSQTDRFFGNKGNDTMEGRGGNDSLIGGDGVDRLHGGDGDDYINGGNDMDFLYGDAGNDRIYGGGGNDVIYDGAGSDTVDAGEGWDFVIAGYDGPDDSDDTYSGGRMSDMVSRDTLSYRSADQGVFIDVEPGKVWSRYGDADEFTDTISGFESYIGTSHSDIFGGSQNGDIAEKFSGGAGDDFVFATAGNDTYRGSASSHDTVDYMLVDAARVTVNLGTGKAEMFENNYSSSPALWTHTLSNINEVKGWDGNDIFYGSSGDDTFHGRGGINTMTGKSGADTFVSQGSEEAGYFAHTYITDFKQGEDVVELNFMHDIRHPDAQIWGFWNLDTNNDQRLTDADEAFYTSGDNGYLQFADGFISFDGISSLTESDFQFV